jgi:hypothetical protein
MIYYSESKKENVVIENMADSHRINAALKLFRKALLDITNNELHYSALSNKSINELTWEDVVQYLHPLAEYIQSNHSDLIDSNLEAFIEYMSCTPVEV